MKMPKDKKYLKRLAACSTEQLLTLRGHLLKYGNRYAAGAWMLGLVTGVLSDRIGLELV